MGDQTQRGKRSARGAAGAPSLFGQKTRTTRPAVRRVAANLGGLLVLLTCLGCGSKLPATKPVTGTVTYLGQPLEGATVMFGRDSRDIAKGELAIAKTDAQGRFALTTHFGSETDAKGVVAGEYEVTISKLVPPPGISPAAYQAMVDAANKVGETGGMLPPDKQPPALVELLPERYSVSGKSQLTAKVTPEGPNDFPFDLK